MQDQRFKVPVCRIYANQIIVYTQYDTPLPRSAKQVETEKNLTRGQYNGFMSPKTKSKVKKYLSTWLHGIEHIRRSPKKHQLDKIPYLTFVTLTLPSAQCHDDNEIKRKCLAPYIQTLQRKYNVWNYFWRAESQKNGNIHFHLLIDSYIHHKSIRDEWNQCVNKLEYVDRFESKHGHANPNSTDIQKLRKVNNLEAYILKYVCKADGYRPIKGRIHGCSDGLKCLQPYEELISNDLNDVITDIINCKGVNIINDDAYTVIFFRSHKLLPDIAPKLWKKMQNHYLDSIIDLYTIQLPPEILQEPERVKIPVYEQSRLFEELYLGI